VDILRKIILLLWFTSVFTFTIFPPWSITVGSFELAVVRNPFYKAGQLALVKYMQASEPPLRNVPQQTKTALSVKRLGLELFLITAGAGTLALLLPGTRRTFRRAGGDLMADEAEISGLIERIAALESVLGAPSSGDSQPAGLPPKPKYDDFKDEFGDIDLAAYDDARFSWEFQRRGAAVRNQRAQRKESLAVGALESPACPPRISSFIES